MLRTSQAASRGVESRRDPASHQCPKTRSDALDEATQTRHAKCPDHYLCDTVEQLFMHLSSLGVKWSQVQILSARPSKVGRDLVRPRYQVKFVQNPWDQSGRS